MAGNQPLLQGRQTLGRSYAHGQGHRRGCRSWRGSPSNQAASRSRMHARVGRPSRGSSKARASGRGGTGHRARRACSSAIAEARRRAARRVGVLQLRCATAPGPRRHARALRRRRDFDGGKRPARASGRRGDRPRPAGVRQRRTARRPRRPTCSAWPATRLPRARTRRARPTRCRPRGRGDGRARLPRLALRAPGTVLAALSGALPAAPAIALEAVRRAQERTRARCRAGEAPDATAGALVTLQLGEPPRGAAAAAGRGAGGRRSLARPPGHVRRPRGPRARAGERRDGSRSSSSARARCSTVVGQAIARALARAHARDRRRADLRAARRRARRASTSATSGARAAPRARAPGPHARVAERLLELALGPRARRGSLDVAGRRRPTRACAASRARSRRPGSRRRSPCRSACARSSIGLLAVYPARGRERPRTRSSPARALAAQLAVAVQNAQLHEETKRARRGAARLRSTPSVRPRGGCARCTRSRARSPRASRSSARSTPSRARSSSRSGSTPRSMRMPDDRGELARARARARARRAAGGARCGRSSRGRSRSARSSSGVPRGEPLVLDARTAAALGARSRAARPVPRAGVDRGGAPDRDAGGDARDADAGLARPGPADRGRDARARRCRSPRRPRSRSTTRASTSSRRSSRTRCSARSSRASSRTSRASSVGAVYESSARVDVGGDVYDFVELARRAARRRARRRDRARHRRDRRHGDGEVRLPLARARALRAGRLPRARERRRRRARSRSASSSRCSTSTVDGREGELVCASAGHPPPRVVLAGRDA